MSSRIKPYQLIILINILFCGLLYFNAFSSLEWSIQDTLYQSRSQVDTRIAIIGIDEPSLKKLGQWPWSREQHAKLIQILSTGNPAVIGIDVIFSEPAINPSEDEALVLALKDARNVVLPVHALLEKRTDNFKIIVDNIEEPIAELKDVVQTGHINTTPDSDGIIRKTILSLDYNEKVIPSFAWTIYNQYMLKQGDVVDMNSVPQDILNRMEVAFTGKPGDFDSLSYSRVLSGEIPPEYFEDKIVLIGPNSVGLQDYYFTPLAHESPMYGIEVHANIIQNLLTGNFKQEVPLPVVVCIFIVLSLLGLVLFNKLSPSKSIIALLLLIFLYLVIATGLYKGGIIIPVFYPLSLITIIYLVFLVYHYLNELFERKRITNVFGRYVAPQIVDQILKKGEAGLQLGGTRREITALFVDIRGFTPLSEGAQPEEVVQILNDYLSLCARSIFKYEGTLDKFIGDAAMAIFNAPLDLDDHEFRAVQAAWVMKNGSDELEKKLQERFGRTVKFGIGIHTGMAVVGNIGSKDRMDYTAIGDTVNTAARLESNAKPGQILMSQATYDRVKDRVSCTCLGEISVKGKSQGVSVFQLDSMKE